MRRHNRKKYTVHGFFFQKQLLTVVVVGAGCALGYVWLGSLCEAQGRTIRELEAEQMSLRQQLTNEEGKWAVLRAVPNLEQTLRTRGLAMSAPKPGQTVRIHGRFYEGWMTGAGGATPYAKTELRGPGRE
jgi:hypothetical protein